MADKYNGPPAYGNQYPQQPQGAYYPPQAGNQDYYGGAPQGGYPQQGYPPQQGGYPPQQQMGYAPQGQPVDERRNDSGGGGGGGCCAGILAAFACCCCLDCLF